MSTLYEHTQKGNPWLYWGIPCILIVPSLVALTVGAIMDFMADSWIVSILLGGMIWAGLGLLPVAIWSGLLLSQLTVWIDSEFVHIRFGFGMWRKKFLLEKIRSAAPVRNKLWWMGWGIHMVGNGWLYNIAGFDAVELIFKNGIKDRIGTNEPEKLAAAIESALKNCHEVH